MKEKSDEDATVEVEMRRENQLAKGASGGGSRNSAPNAYAPRFPKVVAEPQALFCIGLALGHAVLLSFFHATGQATMS